MILQLNTDVQFIKNILLIAFIIFLLIILAIGRIDLLFLWVPAFMVLLIIGTHCTIIIPWAENTDKDSVNFYGYTSDGRILKPGFQGLKSPFLSITLHPDKYGRIAHVIPTQTRDGMRLFYCIETPVRTVRFDPYLFHTLYNHDINIFKSQITKNIKPHLDKYMSNISEADFELGLMNHDDLREQMTKYYPHEGLIWKERPIFVTYFYPIDPPQFDYSCYQYQGLCAYGDSLDLPKASNRYVGQPIPYKDRSANPIPTYTPK